MFDPQLYHHQRQMRHERLLAEAERDRLAAAATIHQQRDHPILSGLLMSVGAALLTMGLRMNMRRLLTADEFSGGVAEAEEIAYVRELLTIGADTKPRPPTSPDPRAPLADCA